MLHEIMVPDLAESTVEATVATWLKKSGDMIEEGEVIIELDTDKVSLEVVSPASGQIKEVNKNEGETVLVGELLGIVDDSVSQSAKPEKPDTKKESKSQTDSEIKNDSNDTEISATPVAKKIAEKGNIDLSKIKGSGPNGKITKNDLENNNDSKKTSDAPNSSGPEEIIKLSRRRITIAKRLKEVQSDTVMTTTYNEVDLSSVISIRKKFQDQFVEKHGIKLGFMSFFVKASVNALQSFPHLNAELYQDELILKNIMTWV